MRLMGLMVRVGEVVILSLLHSAERNLYDIKNTNTSWFLATIK
jgi:hypothetical protein